MEFTINLESVWFNISNWLISPLAPLLFHCFCDKFRTSWLKCNTKYTTAMNSYLRNHYPSPQGNLGSLWNTDSEMDLLKEESASIRKEKLKRDKWDQCDPSSSHFPDYWVLFRACKAFSVKREWQWWYSIRQAPDALFTLCNIDIFSPVLINYAVALTQLSGFQ